MSPRRSRIGGTCSDSPLSRWKRSAPKRTGAHHLGQVPVRRRDDTHVDGGFVVFADAEDAPVLQHPQQLRLEARLHLADLVEQQHATVRRPDESWAIAFGAR